MLIAVLIFAMISLSFLIVKNKSIYTFVFLLLFFSFGLLMLSLTLYIIKMTAYRYFFQFEFVLYYYIANIKISYFDIKNLLNAAVVIFEFAMTVLAVKNCRHAIRKTTVCYFCIFTAATAVYLYFNQSSAIEQIYLDTALNKPGSELKRQFFLIYNNLYIYGFALVPYIFLSAAFARTRLIYKKLHLKVISVVSVIMLALCFFMINMTPLKYFISNTDIYNFDSIGLIYDKSLYIYTPIVVFVMISAVTFILVKYKIFDDWVLFEKNRAYKKSKILVKDIRHLFHSYKNAMFTMNILQKKAVEAFGTEKCMEALNEISENVARFSRQAERFLDIYNKPCLNFSQVSAIACVKKALERVNAEEIFISVKGCGSDIIYGDEEYLSEAFYNVISNAREALSDLEKQNKRITIEVWREDNWICVSITDNGPGISRKHINKIFLPFCSTKQNFNNWGIGLSYTKNVIEAHSGYINVRSEPGSFTEFQILLRADCER